MQNLAQSANKPNIAKRTVEAEGFAITHLLMVAVIAMLVGAMST